MDTFPDILDPAAAGIPDPDGHIPQAYRDVQHSLDRFVEVGYVAAVDAYLQTMSMNGVSVEDDTTYPKQQILDLLAANPPLLSVPHYYKDERENYLWYSDFYDNATKGCVRQYGKFIHSDTVIKSANYAQELTKVDLLYFKELVKLVCLMRLVKYIEARQPQKAVPTPVPTTAPAPALPGKVEPTPNNLAAAPTKFLRSYQPYLTAEQYALLIRHINKYTVFRHNITSSQLRELLEGKQTHLLQVTNQKRLTYLFDRLAEKRYITKGWITVSVNNGNFASMPLSGEERHGDTNPHLISSQQLSNCRYANKSEWINGENHIDDLIKALVDIRGVKQPKKK